MQEVDEHIKEISHRFERIGTHSHVKGLGLDENLRAKPIAAGLVGQTKAREAAGAIVQLAKAGKMAGKAILLAGPPGTGKTAIALAISRELGHDLPFVQLSGSECYSTEMKKTEVILQAMRKAIGVRITDVRRVYEGEVTGLDYHMVPHPYNPMQKIPESATIALETEDDKRSFTISSQVAAQLQQQGIALGDVIMIDKESARISKLGRSARKGVKHYEIEAERTVPVPKGKVEKEREFVYTVTLNDMDEANARRGGGIFSAFFGSPESKEIDPEVREAVDAQVKQWVDAGRAKILPGVLFIDETHLLDIEAFSFMNKAMESELAPIIILASNRGITKIRGTDIKSPHGMPLDLLDRLLIISTTPYKPEEIKEILKIRAKESEIPIEDKALDVLTKIGVETSLRYAAQLLAPAHERAKARNSKKVTEEDINAIRNIFSDVSQSTHYLKEWEEKFLMS